MSDLQRVRQWMNILESQSSEELTNQILNELITKNLSIDSARDTFDFLVRPGNLRKYEDLLWEWNTYINKIAPQDVINAFSESPEKQQAEEQIQALEESIREQRKNSQLLTVKIQEQKDLQKEILLLQADIEKLETDIRTLNKALLSSKRG